MILDLFSLVDRRVLGTLIVMVSLVGAALAWAQRDSSAAAGASALLIPGAALGVVAIVVQPVRFIVIALALGAALMIGGLYVGFGT